MSTNEPIAGSDSDYDSESDEEDMEEYPIDEEDLPDPTFSAALEDISRQRNAEEPRIAASNTDERNERNLPAMLSQLSLTSEAMNQPLPAPNGAYSSIWSFEA